MPATQQWDTQNIRKGETYEKEVIGNVSDTDNVPESVADSGVCN